MTASLTFYAELLVLLVGTFVYGFLARELFRQKILLPGNHAMRALASCLLVWYAGALLDEIGTILFIGTSPWSAVAPTLDVVRGLAWLLSFPLVAHAIWRMTEPRPSSLWILPGYATLLPFVPPGFEILRSGETVLASVSRDVYLVFVVHVSVSLVAAARLVSLASSRTDNPDLVRFLRWLFGTLVIVETLVIVGAPIRNMRVESLWRLLLSATGLVLGMTFLYFVRRYNLMSLSLSNRTLRHFAGILGLLLLVVVAGEALSVGESDVFRRFLALGFSFAVAAGVLYRPLTEWAGRRIPSLARLLARGVPHRELDSLSRELQSLELDEETAIRRAVEGVSRLTGARAHFLRRPDAPLAPVFSYLEDPSARGFNRLRAPSPELAEALVASDLHAVFPVHVTSKLEGVLCLESNATGGGYEDGEMESLSLLARGLGSSISVRRLVEARVLDERRQAEGERLSMLGMVSASLAHELKNPLSSMRSLAQTLQEELSRENAESEGAKDLGLIVDQVDRLSGVTSEILGFARASTNPEGPTKLDAVVDSALYILRAEAKRRGVELELTRSGALHAIPGTPASWQTIVVNLVLNAIHHAPKGSTVRVRASGEEDGLIFECQNEGEPIPAEVADRLFEAFVSGDNGTGLGLALVDRRVREVGGRIELVNEPDNIVFRVCL